MKHFYITIIGYGKFGKAISHTALKNLKTCAETSVTMRFFDPNINQNQTMEHACFSDENTTQKTDSQEKYHWIIPCVPANQTQKIINICNQIKPNAKFLLVSKGIGESGNFIYEEALNIIKDKNRLTNLAGPHFADEILADKPTFSIIGHASSAETDSTNQLTSKQQKQEDIDVTDKAFQTNSSDHVMKTNNISQTESLSNQSTEPSTKEQLKKMFSSMHPIFHTDPLAVDICCVMKNISSFISGLAAGLDLGENMKSIIISKCIEETKTILQCYQCEISTIYESPLIADLILCTTSDTSRNYKAGYELAKGTTSEEVKQTKIVTVESIRSAEKLHDTLSRKFPNVNFSFVQLVSKAHSANQSPDSLRSILKDIINKTV